LRERKGQRRAQKGQIMSQIEEKKRTKEQAQVTILLSCLQQKDQVML